LALRRSLLPLTIILLLPATARPQGLTVAVSPASPGDSTAIALLFESAKDRQIIALQWDLELPAAVLSVEENMITAGEAALQAGKSVQCAGRRNKNVEAYVYRCILSGGQQPLNDGWLAVMRATVAAAPKPGKHSIRLTRILAVNASRTQSALKNTQAAITITPGRGR
jgi:hypothetical protein